MTELSKRERRRRRHAADQWSVRILVGVAALALLVLIALVTTQVLAEIKLRRHIDVTVENALWRYEPEALERGRYLFTAVGCAECHGVSGSGQDVLGDGKTVLAHAPNITVGPGSVTQRYTQRDWIRTVRHGVKPDGRPALFMPSENYNRLTDDDVMAIAAHVRRLPPVRGTPAEIHFPLLMKAMYGIDLIPDAAAKIDHSLPPAKAASEAVSVEQGRYVANTCVSCHNGKLSGGAIVGAPWSWPPAANLTPGEGSVMASYRSAQSLTKMFRTGKRPDGSEVSHVMPFSALKAWSDTDVQALYVALKALPPLRTGEQ